MVADRLALELGAGKFRRAPHCLSLVAKGTIAGTDTLIVKPQTYMNNSGIAVARATRQYGAGPESLIVVYDDMDLEVGGAYEFGQRGGVLAATRVWALL